MEQTKKRKMYELIALKEVEMPDPSSPGEIIKKTYWHTVGRAWSLANGTDGMSLEIFMFGAQRFVIKESLRNANVSPASEANETPF